jgi:signal transduction histidine kinase
VARIRSSLAVRLAAGAGAWIAAALLVGGIVLSSLFRDHVERTFDARLDSLLESLVAVTEVAEDGALALGREVGEPRFGQAFSGWYWQIADGDRVLLRSRSLWDEDLTLGVPPESGDAVHRDATGPDDRRLRLAERSIALPGSHRPLVFAVAGDREEIEVAVAAFDATLAWSLGLLGLGLVLALPIQVRFGLAPLRRLRRAIADIRAGRAARLPEDAPVEIAPLARELNALIEHDAAVIERARTQTGNLAHALKTPLAILTNEATGEGPLAETVRRQVAAMRSQVERHLARARAAASSDVLGARTEVAGVVEDLRRALARIHRDRDVAIEAEIAPGLAFRGERQDLEEMIGNLADNACKWAASRVAIRARADGERLLVTVDDDGPGLAAAECDAVFRRGTRLDETVPGTGHGLAIVREIAELHGGTVALACGPLGGLRAALTLPAAG